MSVIANELPTEANAPHRSQWAERYSKVIWAQRKGVLPPVSEMTCERCDKPAEHKHHEDYTRPLQVMYLCAKCHAARHIELGWGWNASGNQGRKLKYAFDHIPAWSWDYIECESEKDRKKLFQNAYNYAKRFGLQLNCFSVDKGVVIFRTA